VLSTKLVRSSGNPAYDAAVERAILKASPLPLPANRELFARELRLTFRPLDK
jgi:colicin import membrane protein